MASEKVSIITDAGTPAEASAPVIISASRATDIPAFYAPWFFERLERGYCVWYNPFNRKPSYVSFRNCKAIVFWSKNPEPILPYLPRLERKGISYYFQYTLNDYETERFEPGLPALRHRIDTFKRLSDRIGADRVIWRFDPLIITPRLDTGELLRRIGNIGDQLKDYTGKLVFSFVDIAAYRKVRLNMQAVLHGYDPAIAEPDDMAIARIAQGLSALRHRWHREGRDIEMATCAEGIDLSQYGITHNSCIDSAMMRRVFADNTDLMYYLRYGELPVMDLFADTVPDERPIRDFKDKGQRKHCGCMISKDIGMYNTCPHGCAYCYANTSHTTAAGNYRSHAPEYESIIPGNPI